MALDPETIAKISALINVKWRKKDCHLCGANAWVVNGFMSMPLGDKGTELTLGGQIFPCVAVVCGNCGNTHFINGLVAGVVPR